MVAIARRVTRDMIAATTVAMGPTVGAVAIAATLAVAVTTDAVAMAGAAAMAATVAMAGEGATDRRGSVSSQCMETARGLSGHCYQNPAYGYAKRPY
jgi:hypothetical protein